MVCEFHSVCVCPSVERALTRYSKNFLTHLLPPVYPLPPSVPLPFPPPNPFSLYLGRPFKVSFTLY